MYLLNATLYAAAAALNGFVLCSQISGHVEQDRNINWLLWLLLLLLFAPAALPQCALPWCATGGVGLFSLAPGPRNLALCCCIREKKKREKENKQKKLNKYKMNIQRFKRLRFN